MASSAPDAPVNNTGHASAVDEGADVYSPLQSATEAPFLGDRVRAWTTTQSAGSFGMGSDEAVALVQSRWHALQDDLSALGVHRLAHATQVHGSHLAHHGGSWQGCLRLRGVDGHITDTPGTAMAVTVADCTPVFIAHPRGVVAVLHAGWRGTADGILGAGLAAMKTLWCPADECLVHLGPSICRDCYEVGAEVLTKVHGTRHEAAGQLDVRMKLADQAQRLGVQELSQSPHCTKCDATRYFSHRVGHAGRQLGVIALLPGGDR